MVTVGRVWLGYHLNWIRQRRTFLDSSHLSEHHLMMPNPIETSVPPPGLLWLFGESGIAYFYVDKLTSSRDISEYRRVFPEARFEQFNVYR